MINRRKFLELVAGMGIAFTPFYKPLINSFKDQLGPAPSGEDIFSGFVILDENQLPPSFIKYPKIGPQKLCFVGGHAESDDFANIPKQLASKDKLHDVLKSKRIYELHSPLADYSFKGAYILFGSDGSIFGVSQGYSKPENMITPGTIDISLWSQFFYPDPFPVWTQPATDEGHLGVVYEKVDFLPKPGLQVRTPLGYVYHWIEDNIFYMLSMEDYPSLDNAKNLVTYMVKN